MDRTEMFQKVADIASDVLGIDVDSITEETTFDDLDANSLERLQLVTAIEDEFDIEMDEERLLSIASMSDAIDAIVATQQGA
ncbi:MULTISPECIES: acyl carrier protein [Enorma]|uniref:Acyl carrier protein n=1 Tax=[Collinsella] massiliensis TaxID=1232426 RepID=A0A1Y3Y0S5_9ACTN|nr:MULTISPECIES: acyl carrier protein [Enorma]OUN88989.1 phosphopantetheine-binding protein [[Collinsella] massiliensis]